MTLRARLRRLGPTQTVKDLVPSTEQNIWLAGRGSTCHIYTKSIFASRRHFSISYRQEQFFIRDLESANGTFVDDTRIDSERLLAVGSIISVGVPSELQSTEDCIVYIFELPEVNREAQDPASPPSTPRQQRQQTIDVNLTTPRRSLNEDVNQTPSLRGFGHRKPTQLEPRNSRGNSAINDDVSSTSSTKLASESTEPNNTPKNLSTFSSLSENQENRSDQKETHVQTSSFEHSVSSTSNVSTNKSTYVESINVKVSSPSCSKNDNLPKAKKQGRKPKKGNDTDISKEASDKCENSKQLNPAQAIEQTPERNESGSAILSEGAKPNRSPRKNQVERKFDSTKANETSGVNVVVSPSKKKTEGNVVKEKSSEINQENKKKKSTDKEKRVIDYDQKQKVKREKVKVGRKRNEREKKNEKRDGLNDEAKRGKNIVRTDSSSSSAKQRSDQEESHFSKCARASPENNRESTSENVLSKEKADITSIQRDKSPLKTKEKEGKADQSNQSQSDITKTASLASTPKTARHLEKKAKLTDGEQMEVDPVELVVNTALVMSPTSSSKSSLQSTSTQSETERKPSEGIWEKLQKLRQHFMDISTPKETAKETNSVVEQDQNSVPEQEADISCADLFDDETTPASVEEKDKEAYEALTQIDDVKPEIRPQSTVPGYSTTEEVIEISDDEDWLQSQSSSQESVSDVETVRFVGDEDACDVDDVIYLESFYKEKTNSSPDVIELGGDEDEEFSETDKKWMINLFKTEEACDEFMSQRDEYDNDYCEEIIEDDEHDSGKDKWKKMMSRDIAEIEEITRVPAEGREVSEDAPCPASSNDEEHVDSSETAPVAITEKTGLGETTSDKGLEEYRQSPAGEEEALPECAFPEVASPVAEKSLTTLAEKSNLILSDEIPKEQESSNTSKAEDIVEQRLPANEIDFDYLEHEHSQEQKITSGEDSSGEKISSSACRKFTINVERLPLSVIERYRTRAISVTDGESDVETSDRHFEDSNADAGINERNEIGDNLESPSSKRRKLSELADHDDEDGDFVTAKKRKLQFTDALPMTPRKRGRPTGTSYSKAVKGFKKIKQPTLSPETLKKIRDRRKNKLKELSNRPKAETGNKDELIRAKISAPFKIKNTSKNRSDFLCQAAGTSKATDSTSESDGDQSDPSGQSKKIEASVKENAVAAKKTEDQSKACLQPCLIPAATPAPASPPTPPHSSKKGRVSDFQRSKPNQSDLPTENKTAAPATESKSKTLLKSCLKKVGLAFMKRMKPLTAKKSVKFDDNTRIKYYEIEDDKNMRQKAGLRNLNKTDQKRILIDEGERRLTQIKFEICNWNARWLEECKKMAHDTHPEAFNLFKMKNLPEKFTSHKHYMDSFVPLLLAEMWTSISANWRQQGANAARYTVACSSYEDFPHLADNKVYLNYLNCEAVITEFDIRDESVIKEGDLIVLQLHQTCDDPAILSQNSVRKLSTPVFGYVESLAIRPIDRQKTVIHHALVGRSSVLLCDIYQVKLKILIKNRPQREIDTDRTMSLIVIQRIVNDFRSFEAVCKLPRSPLCQLILSPNRPDFQLPLLPKKNKIVFNGPLDSVQTEIVWKLAERCSSTMNPLVAQVSGGAGTGKSHVMIALCLQLLLSDEARNSSPRPKIIFCAHSNVAVDEIALRLKEYRKNLDASNTFEVVRVGNYELMKREVQEISSQYLAKRKEFKTRTAIEIMTLDDQISKLAIDLQSPENSTYSEIDATSTKLNELVRRRETLKKFSGPTKKRSFSVDGEAEIIENADVICTTCLSSGTSKMISLFEKIALENDGQRIVCIVDEAMQSKETETIVPLQLGVTHMILVGDPQLLRSPYISDLVLKRGGYRSLFYRISQHFFKLKANLSPVLELKVQYRMDPRISMYPNKNFYNQRLQDGHSLLMQKCCPLRPYMLLTDKHVEPKARKLLCENEVLKYLVKGILSLWSEVSIAIITCNVKQVKSIKQKLIISNISGVEVNHFYKFQGREFDIVLFLIDSTPLRCQELNLALTRAKHCLYLLVDSGCVKNDVNVEALYKDAQQRNLIRHISPNITEEEVKSLVLST